MCAADSADCLRLVAREKFIMSTVHDSPAAHTSPLMKHIRDIFSAFGGVLERSGWQLHRSSSFGPRVEKMTQWVRG